MTRAIDKRIWVRSIWPVLHVAGAWVVLAVGFAAAATPVVSSVNPTGLRRGEATKIVLSGARLQDARQLLMDRPGIEVQEMKVIDNANVEVTLLAAPELAPGFYPFRLVTETGISNIRLLSVGALPVIPEVEPNSDFSAPQKIDMNVTVTGVVTREDEDYYALELKAGQTITCEVEGLRLAFFPQGNANFFDPFVAILDANRFEQATSDDSPLLQQDALCSFTVREDGLYVVQVRDSSFGGDGGAHYRLHVGDFPRPVAVIPSGGRPGETITATFLGADGSQWQSPVALPGAVSVNHPFSVQTEKGIAPSPNSMRVLPMPNFIEQEPNDNVREPNRTPDALPVAFSGIVSQAKDVDAFAFQAKKGQKVVTKLLARSVLRSPLDAVIDIYNPAFNRIAGNDDSAGPDAVAEFSAPEDGVYVVTVRDHLQGGGPSYAYRIEVEVAAPAIVVSLPEERRDESMTIEVPRGTQTALMVNAERREFGGDLSFAFEGLPAGMTATSFVMPADRPTIPMILSATGDAPLAATLADLTARPTSGQPDVTGHLFQRHKLIAGQNRVDVWGYDSDRAAVAVIAAPPATIEIVPPTAPIVRNGSAGIKVIAHRKEGYTAAIPVRLLYAPPGISTNNSLSIPAEQNELVLPITANGNAAVGPWPMIAIGFPDTGNGAVKVSTLAAELKIEEEFFKFTFNKASVEQGTKGQVLLGVEVARPFEGAAEVKLVGFPAGVTSSADTQPLTAETTEVVFPIEIAADARPGGHKTLNVQAIIHSPGGDIMQTVGTGEIQVNEPLPAPAAPPPPPMPAPAAEAPPQEAPPKPLSRIEQLRLQKQQAPSQGG